MTHKCALCEERDLMLDEVDMTRSVSIGPYSLYESMQGYAFVIDDRSDERVTTATSFADAIQWVRERCPGKETEDERQQRALALAEHQNARMAVLPGRAAERHLVLLVSPLRGAVGRSCG